MAEAHKPVPEPAPIRDLPVQEKAAEQIVGGETAMVFTSVSNVLKTRHDTAKNSIGN